MNGAFYGGYRRLWCLCALLLWLMLPAWGYRYPGNDIPAIVDSLYVLPGHILFKVIPEASCTGSGTREIPPAIASVLSDKNAGLPYRVFPHHEPPAEKYHYSGRALADLSRIFEVVIEDHDRIQETMQALAATGLTEYVQPRYLPEPLIIHEHRSETGYFPNDPLLADQYYLESISAFQAWTISKGDTNTVISIVDTGVDLYHPDLVDAIKYNYDDPINGEDSDYDGYVDNFHGWDLGEGNNDPTFNKSAHGLHVSGIAAATPDNNEGIAGVGFRSKFLPVKIDDEFGRLVKAYEGIVYSADQGVSVINCSWGSHFNSGPFCQDVIDYAVLNKDVLVVAGAGNANTPAPFYPASFDHVVGVAATDSLDRKTGFSSYGFFVDIAAPGTGILSTWVNDSYLFSGGTSMSSPIVAGAAAILRSHFPSLDALQTGAILKMTADPIDSVEENEAYAGLLGHGRLNLYRALTETHWPYIRIATHLTGEEDFSAARPGDIILLQMEFQNLLASAQGVTAVLTTNSDMLDITTDSISLGDIDSMQVIDNIDKPFIISVLPEIQINHEAYFTVTFYDEAQQRIGRHSFRRFLNLDYVNVYAGPITTTVSRRGAIGFNYPDYSQGRGLTFHNGYTVLKSGGILVANSAFQVVDNVYGLSPGSFSETLEPEELPMLHTDHPLAPIRVSGKLRDQANNGHFPLNVGIDYNAFFWDNMPAEDFFILQYHIVNQSDVVYQDMYAGFFADWVLRNNKLHRATFYAPLGLAYAYSYGGGHYTGIQLLSEGHGMRHYAFDNQGAGGSISLLDGFSDFQKYYALTSNRLHAGYYQGDNDISSLLSSGPHQLFPGDTLVLGFAIHLADQFDDMIENSFKAGVYYRELSDYETSLPSVDAVCPEPLYAYPNPFRSRLTVRICKELSGPYSLSLVDLHGRVAWRASPGEISNREVFLGEGIEGLLPGIYVLHLHGPGFNAAMRIIKW